MVRIKNCVDTIDLLTSWFFLEDTFIGNLRIIINNFLLSVGYVNINQY